jgi:septum formation protein
MRLVLASASPRRRDLLAAAGVRFIADPTPTDEGRLPDEQPAAYVERIARSKAGAGLRRHPGDAVLGADTVVVVDGEMLGKPHDDVEAARMLRRLSGRAHEVLTGVALAMPQGAQATVVTTRVWFVELTDADIAWYVASGEPADKAGAYAIQGLASRFVSRLDGSYSNVVGLPVAEVLQLVATSGIPREGWDARTGPPETAE